MSHASGWLEIERSYDVTSTVPLPDFRSHPLVQDASPLTTSELFAEYFDTDDLQLGRRGSALRHRNGGHDAGWHLKTRVDLGHEEVHWKLPFDPAHAPPAEIVNALSWAQLTGELIVIASLHVQRATTLLTLVDSREPAIEFADDRVQSIDRRTGQTRTWREWEIELLQPLDSKRAETLLDSLEQMLFEAGAVSSTAASKLHRALGLDASN